MIESTWHTRNPREPVRINRIHADRNAIEARIFKRLRQVREQVTIGSDRDIERCGRRSIELAQFPHEIHDTFAQKRFPARNPNLRDAKRDQDARHPQVVFKWEIAIERALIPRPAVDALIVAPVSDGNAQVSDGASEFIGKNQLLAPSS